MPLFLPTGSSTLFNTPKCPFYKVSSVYPQIFKDCIQLYQQRAVDNYFINNVEISILLPCQVKINPQLSTVLFKNPLKSTFSGFFVEKLSKNKQTLPKNQQDCKANFLCIKCITLFTNHRNYHYSCLNQYLSVNRFMIIIYSVSFMDLPLTICAFSNSHCTVELLAVLPEVLDFTLFQN